MYPRESQPTGTSQGEASNENGVKRLRSFRFAPFRATSPPFPERTLRSCPRSAAPGPGPAQYLPVVGSIATTAAGAGSFPRWPSLFLPAHVET